MNINGKNYEQYAELIRNSEYSPDRKAFFPADRISAGKLKTKKIRKFFLLNANLDLGLTEKKEADTWTKALELASFVAKNVPHDNQKKKLTVKNAITLWNYSKEVTTGFNCRWHSIMLCELLLAAGIKSTFITCLPMDKNDGDCHVVNHVWLPETGKWAMIDSDMTEYVTDENGTPLSLPEMRSFIKSDREFTINPLPGFENSWYGSPEGKDYMKCYWAKNLYWFARHTTSGYDIESRQHFLDCYICLVPNGYHYERSRFSGKELTHDTLFWNGRKRG